MDTGNDILCLHNKKNLKYCELKNKMPTKNIPKEQRKFIKLCQRVITVFQTRAFVGQSINKWTENKKSNYARIPDRMRCFAVG